MMEPNVYALHGADPEVQAYAMAKYSRSALSMQEAITEISSQRASDFLNTFYFSYGHKSIADLAHVPFAIENISLLAAIEVVDEQRWDGQERSTRYQDFSKREYFVPPGLSDYEQVVYNQIIHLLFDAYDALSTDAFEKLKEQHPRPAHITEAAYERTLRARAFDISRAMLPLATLTSVGQVVNARTLEGQISRMAGSQYAEVRDIADRLKSAATAPAFNVQHDKLAKMFEELQQFGSVQELGLQARLKIDEIEGEVLRPVAAAPTLVKYAEPSAYLANVRVEVGHIADAMKLHDLKHDLPEHESPVTLIEFNSIEEEIAGTLLYEVTNLPMIYILGALRFDEHNHDLDLPSRVEQVIETALGSRGRFDELAKAFRAGQGYCFDIRMDVGGYRDFHRHRRCIQARQPYQADTFTVLPEADGLIAHRAHLAALVGRSQLSNSLAARGESTSAIDYLLPLSTDVRFLLKMDLAEVAYITELRTGPAGHPSYRYIAWEMYKAFAAKHPSIAKHLRVTDFEAETDIFKR
jgi:thymidylate synthase ThyX